MGYEPCGLANTAAQRCVWQRDLARINYPSSQDGGGKPRRSRFI